MTTLNDYFAEIQQETAIDRLAYLLKDGQNLSFAKPRKVRDQESFKMGQPVKVYPDGLEFFIGWGNMKSHLVADKPYIGVFELYVASQGLLFTYYKGHVTPTQQDIDKL